ncbi:MAG: hypothetical protein AB7K09_04965 [Planctomycetota bacterium]
MHRLALIVCLSVLLAASLCPRMAGADTVTKFDGTTVDGSDVRWTGGDTLTIGGQTIALDEVASVKREFTRGERDAIRDALKQREKDTADSDADAQYRLGLLAMVLGDDGLAERCFRRVIKLDEQHAGARAHLGYVRDGNDWSYERSRRSLIKAGDMKLVNTREGGDRDFLAEATGAPSSAGGGSDNDNAAPGRPARPGKVEPWPEFNGWQTTIEGNNILRCNISEAELQTMAARMRECRTFYPQFFNVPAIEDYTISVFATRDQYNQHARGIGAIQNVQGQCIAAKKVCMVCDTMARGGYLQVLSHEIAHAYYVTNSQMWTREGSASFIETFEVKAGKGAPALNIARCNEAKQYINEKGQAHYQKAFSRSMRGQSQDDAGWGESYGVSWSILWYFWTRDPAKFHATLAHMQETRNGSDQSAAIEKIWGQRVDEMEAGWLAMVRKLP